MEGVESGAFDGFSEPEQLHVRACLWPVRRRRDATAHGLIGRTVALLKPPDRGAVQKPERDMIDVRHISVLTRVAQ